MVFIKVCGITSVEDAIMVSTLGVDAIGVVMHPKSKRFVDVELALRISKAVRDKVKVFAVFLKESELDEKNFPFEGFDFIQYYEADNLAVCKRSIPSFRRIEPTFFIYDESRGSGILTNFNNIPDNISRDRLIISGGLTPYNVSFFVRKLNPFGVDVSSGVELRSGIKSLYLVKEFVENIKKEAEK